MNLTRVGRYQIEAELGRGAMATVYKAVDPLIGRVVAIKTIRLEHGLGLEQEEMRQRLYREAQSAGNLNHPNIVTIYDIGEEGDTAYIAMEFIEGESLDSWLVRNPIPPVEQTVRLVEQIASGLDFAAARGIIHRDIKPGNILMTSDGRLKIADFGIAKFSTSKFTQTGVVMGTPSYMSPEQALGKTLDGKSDLFSLGVIFYQMLTGERPFVGSNATTVVYKIVHEDPVPPRCLNVTLHPAFDVIVQRMLAKDPAQRYQSCGEFIHDLKNYTSMGTQARIAANTLTMAGPAVAGAPAARRNFLLPVLAGLLVIAIALMAWFIYQWRSASAPPPAIAAVQQPKPPLAQPVQSSPQVASPPPIQVPTPPPAEEKKKAVQIPAAVEKRQPSNVRFTYLGVNYPVTIYDGARRLDELTSPSSSVKVASGDHQFRIVSEELFLDRVSAQRLSPNEDLVIKLPGLGSAYIEVPIDAYDGCEMLMNGRRIPGPYPASIPKLAAVEHRLAFRWNSGKYAGKEFSSTISIEENRHYGIKGEPQAERVVVQRLR